MDPWAIAAALFAAGAFALGIWEQVRRWRNRPDRSWAVAPATHPRDPTIHLLDIQLIGDAPAYHVEMEGRGLELYHGHHDHDHDRNRWPHEGMVSPGDRPIRLYLQETGETDDPRLVVRWWAPPVRRPRIFEHAIPVVRGVEYDDGPYELKHLRPWRLAWRRTWRRMRRR